MSTTTDEIIALERRSASVAKRLNEQTAIENSSRNHESIVGQVRLERGSGQEAGSSSLRSAA